MVQTGSTDAECAMPVYGALYIQGCQFSDFSLISDLLRINGTGINLGNIYIFSLF